MERPQLIARAVARLTGRLSSANRDATAEGAPGTATAGDSGGDADSAAATAEQEPVHRAPHRYEVALLLLRLGPFLILVVLFIVMASLSPVFFTSQNLTNLSVQASIVAALAVGELLVIIARGVDISVGSVVALSAVVGVMVADWGLSGGLPMMLGFLMAGFAVGFVNAFFVVKGRIPQPLIVTIGTLGIARGLALVLSDGQTESGMPQAIVTAGSGELGPLPVPVLLVLCVAAALYVLTTRTRWGRWLYAIGDNPEAARRLGIPVDRVVMSVYIICGLTAAFAGILVAGRTDSASPLVGQLLELDAVTAVVIGGASLFGGRGSVVNVLAGALILGTIRNGLDLLDVEAFYQSIAIGTLVILALELDVLRAHIERKVEVMQSAAANGGAVT